MNYGFPPIKLSSHRRIKPPKALVVAFGRRLATAEAAEEVPGTYVERPGSEGFLPWEMEIYHDLPLVMTDIAIENGPFIVDFPSKHGDFPLYVSLPEGISHQKSA